MNSQTKVLGRNDSRRKDELKAASKGCDMYDPCEINYRCKNRAVHLYVRCQTCPIQPSQHNHAARSWAIRRENFAIDVTEETGEEFTKLSKALEAKENE